MLRDTDILYREEQKFALWLRWLVYISMSLAVLLTVYALKIEYTQGSEEIYEILLAVVVGIGGPIILAFLFIILKLETEVRPDGIYVRYLPFHIQFKRLAPEDLNEYYARRYRPIQEYGGWGIRCSFRSGKAYNVSGNQGVQLVFKNGKRLLIGSQRTQELETAIHSIVKNHKKNK
jgi:hypothetical protein